MSQDGRTVTFYISFLDGGPVQVGIPAEAVPLVGKDGVLYDNVASLLTRSW